MNLSREEVLAFGECSGEVLTQLEGLQPYILYNSQGNQENERMTVLISVV